MVGNFGGWKFWWLEILVVGIVVVGYSGVGNFVGWKPWWLKILVVGNFDGFSAGA